MAEPSRTHIWVLPDEAVPVRLMNTIWADTDGVHDELRVSGDVDAFLDIVSIDRGGESATPADLDTARDLRDALRRLACHVTSDNRVAASSAMTDIDRALSVVNHVATDLPTPALTLAGDVLLLQRHVGRRPVRAGLALIAEDSMQTLTGDVANNLRACHAPGCVLYFVKSHPRREWCSVACGNRARAARHYLKVRAER
ncbi:CGNR zinc finger domain-containing protein [Smaragdicoccus niigatensis]|uniref:CGNR zinc finger domain-containing protein n=1 Tax=Smaragdicoccus niigatensis TaxID=359359 RepID=UPI00037B069B|nr:CGNR zinc finger domain-containing protein [Smaragdicoccus niigatensis]